MSARAVPRTSSNGCRVVGGQTWRFDTGRSSGMATIVLISPMVGPYYPGVNSCSLWLCGFGGGGDRTQQGSARLYCETLNLIKLWAHWPPVITNYMEGYGDSAVPINWPIAAPAASQSQPLLEKIAAVKAARMPSISHGRWSAQSAAADRGRRAPFNRLWKLDKFVILRYDKILHTECAKPWRENLAKLQVKNLPNLFWQRNLPNWRSSVEQQ